MKLCPTCGEEFEDEELNFCTFDGAPLRLAGLHSAHYYDWDGERGANRWKVAFFVLLIAVLIGGGIGFYFLVQRESQPPETRAAAPPPPAVDGKEAPAKPAEPDQPPAVHLAELSREELLKIIPRNLLRRFHAGEPAQGTPDDLRIVNSDGGEYVVLVGAGKLAGQRSAVERILVLKREDDQFLDVTGKSLPARYASGIVSGQRSDARFEDGNPNLTVREPVSSGAVVDECPTCEHAYQEVLLQWKGTGYVETERVWENDRYTVFYAVADALEKKRVDTRARPLIDKLVDAEIARGFARNGKAGWTVELRGGEDQSDKAEYELSNGLEQLIIALSRVKGQWKAVHIERP